MDRERRHRERGITIFEVVISMFFLSITGLGATRSLIAAIRSTNTNVHHSVAIQLAMETLEGFAAVDPESLDDADDLEEEGVMKFDFSFTRTIDVTIEGNRSRTVSVTVESEAPNVGGPVTLTSSFALWNER